MGDPDGVPLFTVGEIPGGEHYEIVHTMPLLTTFSSSLATVNNGSVIRIGHMKYTGDYRKTNYQLGGWARLPDNMSLPVVEDCVYGCLYNVTADPQERNNLINDPDYEAIVHMFEERIEEIIDSDAWDPGQDYTPTPTPTCPHIMHDGYIFYTPWDDPDVLKDPMRNG